MNIGIIITRIGGVDGVGLETEKWIHVLEKQGHKIFVLTGDLERPMKNTTILPQLYLYHPMNVKEQDHAFFKKKIAEKKLVEMIETNTAFLEKEILSWIVKNKIECICSQNASALPCHLSMGIAIKNILEKTEIPSVLHLHDFYWERGARYATPFTSVKKMMHECFPPHKGKNIKHVVINSFNRNNLKKKFNINATYVPNVMDFNQQFAQKDRYNSDMLKKLGVKKGDIVLSQVTRVVERKGIETAIELVDKLKIPNLKLLITGYTADDLEGYTKKLKKMVKSKKLEKQILFVGDQIDHKRKTVHGRKIYSLSDVYAYSEACTYFSTYEGFGNAFVEAVLAKTPIFVNNYKPVYWPDIGSLGFKTVQIENSKLTNEAVEEARKIIADKKLADRIAQHNFRLGKKYFSYEVLAKKLKKLFC